MYYITVTIITTEQKKNAAPTVAAIHVRGNEEKSEKKINSKNCRLYTNVYGSIFFFDSSTGKCPKLLQGATGHYIPYM